ncbi:MAG: sialidase family protein [Fimbriimonas sp.]
MSLLLGMSGPVAVTPPDVRAREPQVAVTGRRAYVAYGVDDAVFLSRSDNGKAFSSPIRIGAAGRLSLGMRRGPRIVAAGDRVIVSAVYGKRGGGADGDLLAWRSSDGGRTWSGSVNVNDAPGAAREGLHGMAISPTGKVACTWLDLRNKGTEVWASTSSDGGTTWKKNVRVYRSPEGTVCECCHPSAAFGNRNELYVMFRNWLGGARDMYLATSPDGGQSFGNAAKLGTGTWKLNACPMDGGALAVSPDGTVKTVWRRADRVYLCVPGAPERDFGEGAQPWISMSRHSAELVWQRDRSVLAAKEAKPDPVPLSLGINPVVASSPALSLATWADDAGRVWCQPLP